MQQTSFLPPMPHPADGVRNGGRSPQKRSSGAFLVPNARAHLRGPGCRCSRPLFCPLCRIPPMGCKADRDRTDGALGVRPLPRARCGVRRIRKQSSGLFSRRTPGAQAEGRAVDAADLFSAPDAASRRWGAKLTATGPTGPLGCDHCRARPGGVRRIRTQSSGLFSRRTPGAQAEGRAVEAADPFSAPYAASRRWGAKLTATDTRGHLGCDHCRARPRGAGRARSDLLWANLTG